MSSIRDVLATLSEIAPLELAEPWDNVGLLLGSAEGPVTSVLTCLTLTPDVADEAIREQCELVVTHHPILFHAVQRVTDETAEGDMLLRLAAHGVAVYSAHTAYDNARGGINEQIARSLGLSEIAPLRPAAIEIGNGVGGGRFGRLEKRLPIDELCERVKAALGVRQVEVVRGTADHIERVGIACGSAAEYLTDAERTGCQAFLTGEAKFHDSLSARASGVTLILAGHYATERPGIERLAADLASKLPKLRVFASRAESNPLEWA